MIRNAELPVYLNRNFSTFIYCAVFFAFLILCLGSSFRAGNFLISFLELSNVQETNFNFYCGGESAWQRILPVVICEFLGISFESHWTKKNDNLKSLLITFFSNSNWTSTPFKHIKPCSQFTPDSIHHFALNADVLSS